MASASPHKHSRTDVLIIGAGPSGLMMANWMSRLGVPTRIVDKHGTKTWKGHADGVQIRTMEVLGSFGLAGDVLKVSNSSDSVVAWVPNGKGGIERGAKQMNTGMRANWSHHHAALVHQGFVEQVLLDSIAAHSNIAVERGLLPEVLECDNTSIRDYKAYPIRVAVRQLSRDEAMPRIVGGADDTDEMRDSVHFANAPGSLETIEARYLVGCDGAHSWVRRSLGIEMFGETTDVIFGVIDILPITDFPDIRIICPVQSPAGSMLLIPRENNLVRVYVQLSTTDAAGKTDIDRSKVTPRSILAIAQKILHPYKITYNYCEWWTTYQIGQRVAQQFTHGDRIFLAGDAVHTHSPKAGQGMNVSMADTYNLGWKMAAVLKGLSDPSILGTYQSERRRVAQDLIDLDHQIASLYANPHSDKQTLAETYHKNMQFISGFGVDYGKSMLIAKEGSVERQGDGTKVVAGSEHVVLRSSPDLATGIQIGMRLPSVRITGQCTSHGKELHDLVPSDGRWRILLFAGDAKHHSQRLHQLCAKLDAQQSFLRRFTPATGPIDAVIECLAIHHGTRTDFDLFEFPSLLRPFTPRTGWNYHKVFVDDGTTPRNDSAYEKFGINVETGCAVIVRPDQYVSWIGELDDYASMDAFFGEFMRVQPDGGFQGLTEAPENWAEECARI